MKYYWPSLVTILFAGLFIVGCTQSGKLTIEDTWARPATAGENGAVYFTIQNRTGQSDTLLGVTGDLAESIEIHRSAMAENGVMTMQKQDSVAIPSRGEIAFEPGGLHVMLVKLKQNLQPGLDFEITLKFEKLGEIPLSVPVREP